MGQRTVLRMEDAAVAADPVREVHERSFDGSEADILMTIGDVAREFGITLRALRFYESKRLIAPQRTGTIRLYRRGDRERIALILCGRRLGFTLNEIKGLLDGSSGEWLHLTRKQCVEQINLLERQKRGIEMALAELRQIYTSFYKSALEDERSLR